MDIRTAVIDDLDFLVRLENSSFSQLRRSNRKSIRHSIESAHQKVFIINNDTADIGSVVLLLHKTHIRIYSIAVLDGYRYSGAGSFLLRYVIDFAMKYGASYITLEADIRNDKLIRWYESFGFEAEQVIVDYYAPNEDAMKMQLHLERREYCRNIIVIDFDTDFFDNIENISVIKAITYIEDEFYQNLKNAKVFNLCRSLNYQTVGYYVSLLALARNHSVFPNIISLRDIKNSLIINSIGDELSDQLQAELNGDHNNALVLDCCFGYCNRPEYQSLIKALNLLYDAPLIRYHLVKKDKWYLQKIHIIKLADIEQTLSMKENARRYFSKKYFINSSLSHYEYDMAILVDYEEAHSPSCRVALNKFKLAAKQLGVYVEFITKRDYTRIPEFDALFIRATTNVNNYTYDFSRYAYAEGLVVIDDPWSILRCSNKLYLYEALKGAGIKMPQTWAVKKSNRREKVNAFQYPIILKQPDSAFSIGVLKANSPGDCMEKLNVLFKHSEIVVAQEYIPTAYDWRIGVLDKKPIFACKYYMAKGHWQIYNWDELCGEPEGDSETLPIELVPQKVLRTAVKAANVMGDGFLRCGLKRSWIKRTCH